MKKFLQKNRIYFELIIPILLSLVALIISVITLIYTQRQAENEEFLNNPDLKISNLIFSYQSERNNSHFVIIENTGNKLREYHSNIFTILKIEGIKEPEKEKFSILIPIQDYFGGVIPSDSYKGEIEKFIGIDNLNLAKILEKQFKEMFNSEFSFISLSMNIILRVSYKNFRGDSFVKTFSVNEFNPSKEIDLDKELGEIVENWDSLEKSYLYQLGPENLYELMKK